MFKRHTDAMGIRRTRMSLMILMMDADIRTMYWSIQLVPYALWYGTHCKAMAKIRPTV